MVPSHYLNQCWLIVEWILRNKLQWNSNQNTKLFIHENWKCLQNGSHFVQEEMRQVDQYYTSSKQTVCIILGMYSIFYWDITLLFKGGCLHLHLPELPRKNEIFNKQEINSITGLNNRSFHILLCIREISHNVPFCNRKEHRSDCPGVSTSNLTLGLLGSANPYHWNIYT